jgi:hypothetical protein
VLRRGSRILSSAGCGSSGVRERENQQQQLQFPFLNSHHSIVVFFSFGSLLELTETVWVLVIMNY